MNNGGELEYIFTTEGHLYPIKYAYLLKKNHDYNREEMLNSNRNNNDRNVYSYHVNSTGYNDDYEYENAENSLTLICWGEGRKPGTSLSTGYSWDHRRNKFVPETYIQNTTKEFDSEVQIELHDDWGRIQPTQVSVVRDLPASEVHLIDANSVMHFDLAIRTEAGRALFDDVRVRRAIFHAIDREGMAKKLMEGTVKVAEGPINPNSPYHNAKVATYPYDLARSRRLLDEASWTMGADGVRRKNGRRFSFVMLNRAGSTDRILLAQVIQAGLKAVGVEVNFETLESAAWTQRWRSGKWEAIVSAWFLPADPGITGLYACKGANNMAGFCDPALDEILERSDKALSFDARMPRLHEAQASLAEQARMLPLYQNVMPEIVTKRVSGYRGSGTNFGSFWNLWEWRLDGAGE